MQPTPAQLGFFHTLESVGVSALFTLFIGISQQLTSGHVAWGDLGTIFGSGFIAAMLLIYKTMRSYPQLPQVEADTVGEITKFVEDHLNQAETRLSNLVTTTNATRAAISSKPTLTEIPAVVSPAPAQPRPAVQQPQYYAPGPISHTLTNPGATVTQGWPQPSLVLPGSAPANPGGNTSMLQPAWAQPAAQPQQGRPNGG